MTKDSRQGDQAEYLWRTYLTKGEILDVGPIARRTYKTFKRVMRTLPTDPRCFLCYAPFEGVGGRVVRTLLGRTRSRLNPQLCNVCEQYAEEHQGGAEVEISMLFADVRGSTTLAEGMSPLEYSQLINRFYQEASSLLIESYALLGQLIGDQVSGFYAPGLAGEKHARRAVETALAILKATGHADPQGPWIPVGIGVHTGIAFVGAVGTPGGATTITALGDAVNTAARLSSQAGPGEILISETTCQAAGVDTTGLESRELSLKGRTEPVKAFVLHSR
jgi:adenylate cyclase